MTFLRVNFLAALIFLMGCGGAEVDFARSLAVPQPADLILRNGKIVTVDRNFSIKQAVAIKDGRFIAVGSDRDMRLLTGPRTRVVDLGGRTVIPGLIDAQIHATRGGFNWDAELHWELLTSLAEGLKLVGKAAESRPAGGWIIVAGGWMPEQFLEKRLPTRAELDSLAPNHPVYLQYLNLGALLNSTGLKALGISATSADPAGGKFERAANGELTGWLRGAPAWQLAYDKIPKLGLDQARQSLRRCFGELNRLGVTSVHDLQGAEVSFAHRRILAEMARGGELTVRLNFYINANAAGDPLGQLNLAAAEVKHLPQSDWFRFAGFAAEPGGVISDDRGESKSAVSLDSNQLERLRGWVRFFAERGDSYRLHGSPMNDVLGVLEQVQAITPLSRQRVGLADVDKVSPDAIERVKKLGAGMVALAGAETSPHTLPLRKLLDAAIPLAAGSDGFLSGNYSPWFSLWRLVTGKSIDGATSRDKEQNLSREEALRIYTMGSAWLTADTQRKGSIEVDKLADLVVLNADYLTVREERIRSLESLLTMVGGRVVYSAKPFGPIETMR